MSTQPAQDVQTDTTAKWFSGPWQDRDAKIHQLCGNLPVYFGTGDAIREPHVLVTNHWGADWIRRFPEGDGGYMGATHDLSFDWRVTS